MKIRDFFLRRDTPPKTAPADLEMKLTATLSGDFATMVEDLRVRTGYDQATILKIAYVLYSEALRGVETGGRAGVLYDATLPSTFKEFIGLRHPSALQEDQK